MLIVLFLGFSAGLPLALSGSTLLIWMREAGVDLGTIGLFALVGTPYTVKFLWAPVVDALDVPILSPLARPAARLARVLAAAADRCDRISRVLRSRHARRSGSRSRALLVSRPHRPRRTSSSTRSAIESLPESEQAAGMASYVAAYRIGMLVSGAGALFLVSAFEWLGARREHGLDRSAIS